MDSELAELKRRFELRVASAATRVEHATGSRPRRLVMAADAAAMAYAAGYRPRGGARRFANLPFRYVCMGKCLGVYLWVAVDPE